MINKLLIVIPYIPTWRGSEYNDNVSQVIDPAVGIILVVLSFICLILSMFLLFSMDIKEDKKEQKKTNINLKESEKFLNENFFNKYEK